MVREHSAMEELAVLISRFEEQKKQIYEKYDLLVNYVLAGCITSEREIEQIMDSLIDFGDEDRFLGLYKKLCRHVYKYYPQLVGEHIHLFRLLCGE